MGFKNLLVMSTALAVLFSCETDDVSPPPNSGPEVRLSLSTQVISEDGGTCDIVATLTESSTEDVNVVLDLGGSAILNTDYTITLDEISISAGDITNFVTIDAINDTAKTGNKTVLIDIKSVAGGFHDGLQGQTLIIEDDDVPPAVSLIFNEVLYDPPSGLDGDANGDGVRDPLDDEFIEFINLSAQDLDMSGYKIYDTDALTAGVPRHEFPAGSILSGGKAMVVFGGGTPTGGFGGATVQTASSGELNMSNAGDLMTVTDATGLVLVTFDIEPLSNNPDESYTRNPDITGDFEQHATNTPLLFSPGTKIDSSPF